MRHRKKLHRAKIKVPRYFGEAKSTAFVVSWLKDINSEIEQGDTVCILSVDGENIAVTSPVTGKLQNINRAPGQHVHRNETLGYISYWEYSETLAGSSGNSEINLPSDKPEHSGKTKFFSLALSNLLGALAYSLGAVLSLIIGISIPIVATIALILLLVFVSQFKSDKEVANQEAANAVHSLLAYHEKLSSHYFIDSFESGTFSNCQSKNTAHRSWDGIEDQIEYIIDWSNVDWDSFTITNPSFDQYRDQWRLYCVSDCLYIGSNSPIQELVYDFNRTNSVPQINSSMVRHQLDTIQRACTSN